MHHPGSANGHVPASVTSICTHVLVKAANFTPSQTVISCVQVIDAEMARRKLLEESPIASTQEEPVLFDTSEIPWWAWVRRFHLPEASYIDPGTCDCSIAHLFLLCWGRTCLAVYSCFHLLSPLKMSSCCKHCVNVHVCNACNKSHVCMMTCVTEHADMHQTFTGFQQSQSPLMQAEKINGRVCMVGYATGYFVDALTGHGLVDQQNSFLGKLLLIITVLALLVYRNNSALPAYKNLLDEATFYDKQWQATWEGQNRPSESEK